MGIKGILKQANVQSFLFFLMLTTIIAVVIKLSKEYETTITMPIVVVNLPEDMVLTDISSKDVEVALTINGFNLVRNQFLGRRYSLDFLKATKRSDSVYVYLPAIDEIRSAFNGAALREAISPNEVILKIDTYASRKIPILPDISITYEAGFAGVKPFEIKPDSVNIIGPYALIENIPNVETVAVSYPNTNSNIRDSIQLKVDSFGKNITIVPSRVSLEQSVSKFTERTLRVPIEVTNTDELTVNIFPKDVAVTFTLPLDQYDNVAPSDFAIISDYNKRIVGNNHLLLSLSKQPEYAGNVRLETKQVQYITINQ